MRSGKPGRGTASGPGGQPRRDDGSAADGTAAPDPFAWSVSDRTADLRPAAPPFEDLFGRVIRLTVEDRDLVGYGWGGRRVAVPLGDVRALHGASTRVSRPKGEAAAVDGLLALGDYQRVLLRVDGVWRTDEVVAFAKRYRVNRRFDTTDRGLRRILARANRAPGYQVLHCRSRLLGLWWLARVLVPPALVGAGISTIARLAAGEAVAGVVVAVVLAIAAVPVMKRLPEWIRVLTHPLAVRRQPALSADHRAQVSAARLAARRTAPRPGRRPQPGGRARKRKGRKGRKHH